MFGKDYDTFLDNVYDAASEELRAGIDQFLNYNAQHKRDKDGNPIYDDPDRYQRNPDGSIKLDKNGKPELEPMRDHLADRRQAVDEYLAHLAEKRPQNLTQPERTLWAKIKEWFISLLRQKGFNIKRLTDEDLIDLLRESHRRLLQQEAVRRQASPEAPADRTQVLRTSEPGAPVVGETPAEGEGVNRFGSRVNKRMADISSKLAGMEMDENQRKVVSVFTGESDNEPISIQRTDVKNVRLILRQGNENRSGSKHSLFRHYGTNSSPYSAKDILSITKTVEKGTRKRKNNNKSIEYRWNDETGSTYFVITDIKNGREEFANFYKTEKVSPTARETPSNQARAVVGDTFSTGKDTQNSPTDQTNPQQSATDEGKTLHSLPQDTTPEERKAYVEE